MGDAQIKLNKVANTLAVCQTRKRSYEWIGIAKLQAARTSESRVVSFISKSKKGNKAINNFFLEPRRHGLYGRKRYFTDLTSFVYYILSL